MLRSVTYRAVSRCLHRRQWLDFSYLGGGSTDRLTPLSQMSRNLEMRISKGDDTSPVGNDRIYKFRDMWPYSSCLAILRYLPFRIVKSPPLTNVVFDNRFDSFLATWFPFVINWWLLLWFECWSRFLTPDWSESISGEANRE